MNHVMTNILQENMFYEAELHELTRIAYPDNPEQHYSFRYIKRYHTEELKKEIEELKEENCKLKWRVELQSQEQEPPLDTTQPPLTLAPKKKAGRPPGVKNKPKTISPAV